MMLRLRPYIALWVLLSACPFALRAEDRVAIFRGDSEGEEFMAFSVPEGSDPDSYRRLADRPNRVVLVYEDYAEASRLEPRAVFSGSGVTIVNDQPLRVRGEPTIADLIKEANVGGPKKLGVVCRDGTRVSPSGKSQATQLVASWRACSRRGGPQRWYQTTTRDTNAAVATICRDYLLVAGSGRDCGSAGRLASVRNRKY